MKSVVRLLGFALFLCFLPALHAADLSGRWTGTFDFQGTSMPISFNLKAADTSLTGTVEGLPTSPADIHEGKIDGAAITFWVNTDYEGQTYKLVYKGKVNGDSIDFDFGTEDGSWGTVMTAKREAAQAVAAGPVDVNGNWTGSFDFNGTSMPVTFKLKSSGATLTGTVEGMGPAPIEIKDGKVDGDSVTFNINVDYQGQTYTLAYKGKVQAGQISFDFGTSDGSWGSSVNAKKS